MGKRVRKSLGKKLVELTKEKVQSFGKVGVKIYDPLREGYYTIFPVSPSKLAKVFSKLNVTLEALRQGKIDLDLLEKLENHVIAESLPNWTLDEVEAKFPSDMKEPLTYAILNTSNIGVSEEKLKGFFRERPKR